MQNACGLGTKLKGNIIQENKVDPTKKSNKKLAHLIC